MILPKNGILLSKLLYAFAKSAGAIEYTDWFSAEG